MTEMETATGKMMREMKAQRLKEQIGHMTENERQCFYMGLDLANQQWADKFHATLNQLAPAMTFKSDA